MIKITETEFENLFVKTLLAITAFLFGLVMGMAYGKDIKCSKEILDSDIGYHD